MALQKTIDTQYGNATYWKAFISGIDTLNDVASISMYGYSSVEAKDAGKTPFEIKRYFLTLNEITFTHHNITLSDVYTYLKTLTDFNGATDI